MAIFKMTKKEAIAQLKMDRDLCNFNPMTGEEEPMNEDCRKSAEALDMAIKVLEQSIDKEKMIEELEESLQKANATNTKLILLVEDKQKPCEDAVSRKAIEKLKRYRFSYDNDTTIPKSDLFVKLTDLRDLRSVAPARKLKQEPCKDAISRKAVLDTLDKMDSVLDEDRTLETYKKLLTACYKDLPSVTSVYKKECRAI